MNKNRKTYKKVLWLTNIILIGGLFISVYCSTLSGSSQALNNAAINSDAVIALHADSTAYMKQG